MTTPKRSDGNSITARQTCAAILTDVQFWIPVSVLALGVGLLVVLH